MTKVVKKGTKKSVSKKSVKSNAKSRAAEDKTVVVNVSLPEDVVVRHAPVEVTGTAEFKHGHPVKLNVSAQMAINTANFEVGKAKSISIGFNLTNELKSDAVISEAMEEMFDFIMREGIMPRFLQIKERFCGK